jgi:exoribonuclease R
MQSSRVVKIVVEDPQYCAWSCVDPETNEPVDTGGLHPAEMRLFHGDIVALALPDGAVAVTASPVTETPSIPGVMLLSAPPCGKCARTGKMMYRVAPEDRRLPEFMVPAEPKIEFCKARVNTYVRFAVREWTAKHPVGTLLETLGRVDDLAVFYTYSLHVAQVDCAMGRAAAAARRAAVDRSGEVAAVFAAAADRRAWAFETFDAPGAGAFDDAIRIAPPGPDPAVTIVSVAIANVAAWTDALDLWSALPARAATVYMPDRRHPMLPPALGDDRCSLVAGADRLAMVVDFFVKAGVVYDISFTPVAAVRVAHNYTFMDNVSDALAAVTRSLEPDVADTDAVVRYWMRAANAYFAHHLSPDQAVYTDESQGSYVSFVTEYARATSPMRRLADLVNQILLMGPAAGFAAQEFARQWSSPEAVARIDMLSRKARKAQSVARMLDVCTRAGAAGVGAHRGETRPGNMLFFPELRVWFPDPRPADEGRGTDSIFEFALFPGAHAPYRKVRLYCR